MSYPSDASAGRPSSSLHFAVGEINGKMDQLIASILPQFTALREADQALDVRVTALEKGQWLVVGGGTLLVFIVSAWEIVRVILL